MQCRHGRIPSWIEPHVALRAMSGDGSVLSRQGSSAESLNRLTELRTSSDFASDPSASDRNIASAKSSSDSLDASDDDFPADDALHLPFPPSRRTSMEGRPPHPAA
jgi:hypothetical protein